MNSSMRGAAATLLALLSACTPTADDAAATPDASAPFPADTGTAVVPDGALGPVAPGGDAGAGLGDASAPPFDAAPMGGATTMRDAQTDVPTLPEASVDAYVPGPLPEASLPPPRDGGAVCNTPQPHGCYRAKAGNDPNCPAQMPEQSGYYPPLEEWKGCSSPYYQACVYFRPDGTEANCACDLGLHWLCTY